jgi:hypothetical protein
MRIIDRENIKSTINKTSLVNNLICKFFKLTFVKLVIIEIYIKSVLKA